MLGVPPTPCQVPEHTVLSYTLGAELGADFLEVRRWLCRCAAVQLCRRVPRDDDNVAPRAAMERVRADRLEGHVARRQRGT